jgi:redox-sensitive bicupin YhaK (pirin superfamily)
MFNIRSNKDRGHAHHGWLDTHYSFSFADYFDPENMGFRALRVINEDRIAPGRGFGTHGHQNMEILTYMLGGTLEHKDSLGSGGLLRPGDVQFMSAGSGVRHSEINPSPEETAYLLQIWLLPNQQGLDPLYGQKRFPIAEQPNRLHAIATRDGRAGSFLIRTDAEVAAARLDPGASLTVPLALGYGWLQVARGALTLHGAALTAGDGVAITAEPQVTLQADAKEGAEFLLFDLA